MMKPEWTNYIQIKNLADLNEYISRLGAELHEKLIVFQTTALPADHEHCVELLAQAFICHYNSAEVQHDESLFPRVHKSLLGLVQIEGDKIYLLPARKAAGRDVKLLLDEHFFSQNTLVMRQMSPEDVRILKLRVPLNRLHFSVLSGFDASCSELEAKLRKALLAIKPIAGYWREYPDAVFDVLSLPMLALPTEKRKLILALDYDDVLAAKGDSLGDIMANIRLLILKAIAAQQIDLASIDSIEVMITSSRQSQFIDHYNQSRHKNGLAFLIFPEVVSSLRDVFAPLGIAVEFNPLTLTDVYYYLEEGSSVNTTISPNPAIDESLVDYYFDPTKLLLILFQMHTQANKHPEQKIDFLFVDDNEDRIIPHLVKVFTQYPELIPRNMTFRILRYCMVAQDPHMSYQFQGTGDVHPDPKTALIYLSVYAGSLGEPREIIGDNNSSGFASLLFPDSPYPEAKPLILEVWQNPSLQKQDSNSRGAAAA